MLDEVRGECEAVSAELRPRCSVLPAASLAERLGISRDQMLTALHEQNIGTGVHYRAIPDLRAYRERYGWRSEDYPNAKAIGDRTISLPLSPRLSDQDVDDVIAAIKTALRRD
mgnify:CR=1 FL=1